MSTDRLAVAGVLEQIATFLEFQGGNPFRIRAFRNAAKAVMSLPGSAADALADGSLAATRGIGAGTLAIVQEVLATGRSDLLEQLKREIPAGLLEMLAIPGLGVARIRVLHERLRIETLAELEAAARDGRLATLPGFGAKTADKVLKGITFARGTQALRLGPAAAAEAEVLRSVLEGLPGVTRAVVAGQVRRCCEVVSELALVAVAETSPEAVRASLAKLPGLAELAVDPEGIVRFRPVTGLASGARMTTAQHFGAAWVSSTGSDAHLALLAAHAAREGHALARGVLSRGATPVSTPDEAALYAAIGLPEIPPELREGGDEVARAAAGALPRLLEFDELAGFLHCHTSYSDGTLGVEEMALVVRDAGYSYLGITDHSRSAAYAGGMSVDEVQRQWEEIDAVNARLPGLRVLKGIESDILADGGLDYDDTMLAGFDFVIGSIHSRLSLSEAEMTARLLRALDNPYLTILGHPTGRLLLSRNPYPLDLEQVFTRAAARGVALEINGDPHRLDLDWRLVRRARALGVTCSLGADAHGKAGLEYMRFATRMARKGGLEKGDVLNTRPVDQFLAFARARRP